MARLSCECLAPFLELRCWVFARLELELLALLLDGSVIMLLVELLSLRVGNAHALEFLNVRSITIFYLLRDWSLLYCRLLPRSIHILYILILKILGRLWYVCNRAFGIEVLFARYQIFLKCANLNVPLIVNALLLTHAFIHAIHNNGVYLLHSWVVWFGVRVDLFILGIPAGHGWSNWEASLLLRNQFPIACSIYNRIN